MSRIAVMVENTLHPSPEALWDAESIPDPFPDAKEFLDKLKAAGHHVVIMSSRTVKREYAYALNRWLIRNGLNYDDVWCLDGLPDADFYVGANFVPVSKASGLAGLALTFTTLTHKKKK